MHTKLIKLLRHKTRTRQFASNSPPVLQLTTPHPGQLKILDHPARFKIAACGRRWGKTELGKTAIIRHALEHNHRCWWLAPTKMMASQTWRELKNSLIHLPGLKLSETERRIDLPNGGMIAVRSAFSPDNLRGQGLDFAVLDEAAFMNPRAWNEVVRPMLVTTRGRALFLSTPNGRNWFWDLFRIGLDPEENEWASFHLPTADNSLIAEEELDNIRRLTPDHIWRAEYEAAFLSNNNQVFRGIEAANAPHPYHQPQPGHAYIAGIDWGRSSDYTAIAVIDAANGKMVALDRFKDASWSLQRRRLANIVKRWRPQIVWAEANSIGEPNIEALNQQGLPVRPFYTTAKSKAPLIESLALAIERQEITLLNDPVLLAELADYSLERLPNGGYRYGAPPGQHDDTVIATALAWYGARFTSSPLAFA